MTKAEIAAKIFTTLPDMTKRKATALTDDVIDVMCTVLATGEDIVISGFGKFEVKKKLPRCGRNPQTGEKIEISGRKVLTFKPSTILRAKINGDV